MPAPGDQHTTVTNPFEEPRLRVAEWAAKEIATIAAKLDKQLGPEYISARAGLGGPSSNPAPQRIQQHPSRSISAGPANRPPQTPNQEHQRPDPSNGGSAGFSNRPQPRPAGRTTPNQTGNPQPPPNVPQNMPETVGFFSAKAVNQLSESTLQGSNNARLAVPHGQQAFNPKAESPSIRKTPGIDRNSSKPVAKNGQHLAPASSPARAAPHSNA
ncbi:hypothetical protein MRS44_013360 [Fusarium solani]|uniref:uncharacterized protein n=1 Tax=Fusarium solani TaxID=169388 RepID=UPI0032C444A6|nr:hypothetical protein MRS44_013360 [Fusarium solani]